MRICHYSCYSTCGWFVASLFYTFEVDSNLTFFLPAPAHRHKNTHQCPQGQPGRCVLICIMKQARSPKGQQGPLGSNEGCAYGRGTEQWTLQQAWPQRSAIIDKQTERRSKRAVILLHGCSGHAAADPLLRFFWFRLLHVGGRVFHLKKAWSHNITVLFCLFFFFLVLSWAAFTFLRRHSADSHHPDRKQHVYLVAVKRLVCLFPLAERGFRMFPFPSLPGNIKGHRGAVVRNNSMCVETFVTGSSELKMMQNPGSACNKIRNKMQEKKGGEKKWKVACQ